MIISTSSGESFHALANYLVSEKPGVHAEDRLAHAEAFNLGVYSDLSDGQSLTAEQLKSIAFLQTDTAKLSNRVEKPSYQFSVSFAPGDKPTLDQIRESAKGYVDALGLSENEWYFVKQDDTSDRYKGTGKGYDQFHVSVNRVLPTIDPKDPEKLTGRAVSVGQDWPVLEAESRRQEALFGFQAVPGPHSGKEPNERGNYHAPTRVELEKSIRNDTKAMIRMDKDRCKRVREELAPAFERSGSWAGFQARLREAGYKLEVVGSKGGLRVVRGMSYAKLSDLTPPKVNVKALRQKWGAFELDSEGEEAVRPKAPKRAPKKRRTKPKREAPKPKVQASEDDGLPKRKPNQSRKSWIEEMEAYKRKRRRLGKDRDTSSKDDPDYEL